MFKLWKNNTILTFQAEGDLLEMRVALVIGASRGMGKQVAVTLSKNGYAVGVAAKTTAPSEKTPGTIYDVCKEIEAGGGKALPIKVERMEGNM